MIRLALLDDAFARSRAELARRARRRWKAALGASLVLHTAIAGAAWTWGDVWDIRLLRPQAGRASIALTASLAARPESPAPEAVIEAPLDEAALEADVDQELLQQSDAAITRDEASRLESALRLIKPTEPMIVIVEDAVTPILVGGPAERNKARREPPPQVAESRSQFTPRRQLEGESAIPSPASAPAPASVAASGVDAENPPKILLNPPPIYPPEALAAGRTGRVIVRAEIAASGRVIEVLLQRSSGVASLDRAAVAAVRQWRFSSAPNTAAAPRRVDVPIDFVIRRQP